MDNYKIHKRINHRAEVASLAEVIKGNLAVDFSRWGISAPYTDPENSLIYRDSLFSLSIATMPEYLEFWYNEEEEGYCQPHYPNAAYGSIWDY